MWQLVAVLPMFGETGGRLPRNYRSLFAVDPRTTHHAERRKQGWRWMDPPVAFPKTKITILAAK
jgi:hypothetical protein